MNQRFQGMELATKGSKVRNHQPKVPGHGIGNKGFQGTELATKGST